MLQEDNSETIKTPKKSYKNLNYAKCVSDAAATPSKEGKFHSKEQLTMITRLKRSQSQ